jgi:hypothetical protein
MNNIQAPNKKPRCEFISKTGSRCHADPQTGKDWCFFHDPEQKKKQAEARKQGGEARSRQTEPEITLPPDLPVVRLATSRNVFDLLAETVRHLQCGEMDIHAAKALAYLSSLLLRALKAGAPGIAGLLSDTINQVRRDETDLQTGKTIGHLASIMLTALKQEAEEEAIMASEALAAKTANSLAKLAARFSGETGRIAVAQPPDGPKPHPAVINAMATVAEPTHA